MLVAIIGHAGKDMMSWPKRETISSLTGLPPSRVSEVTAKLVDLGYLEKASGGRGRPTCYRLLSGLDRVTETVTPSVADRVTETVTPSVADRVTETVSNRVTETVSPPIPSSEQTIEQTNKKEKKKKENPPPPLLTKPAKKPAAKRIPNQGLFEQAWELAREINRTTPSRCCRKTSLARWTTKCQDIDAAKLCFECWELEVNSRRADSGLAFQRGFQVYLSAEPWTDPHAVDDLRAAKNNVENGNGNTNGSGARPRYESSVERYDRAHRAYFDRAIAEEERQLAEQQRELDARTFDAEPQDH